jgi:hypothetical protein
MIDLHAHILPGLDDGPATLDDAIAILRAAVGDGTELIAATPHVRDDYPTTPQAMETGLAELRSAIDDERIPIQVTSGGEIALDQLSNLDDSELRRFTLGDSHHVLIETPYLGWPLDLRWRARPDHRCVARRPFRTGPARRRSQAAEPRARTPGCERRARPCAPQGRLVFCAVDPW